MRVKFTDWWHGWKWQDYPLCNEILHKKLGMEIVDENPDLIVYSVFFDRGDRRSKFNGTIDAWNPKYKNIPKVCFSGESMTDAWINKMLNHGDYLMYSKKVNHPK